MRKFSVLVVFAALASTTIHAPAEARQSATGQRAAALPPLSEVLDNVRRAVGYRNIRRFGPGFTIVERDPQGQSHELQFGTRRGELRDGREFVYDGALAWQFDARRAVSIPSPIRQRQKLGWPLWVRSHWWLNPASGFRVSIAPEQGDARQVALMLAQPGGVVEATVFVDRSTWLPERLVLPYERGPFTAHYSDYRSVEGVRFPFAIETSYREASRRSVASITRLASTAEFARPPLPNDHRFYASRPAALETRQGVPFSGGTPGHVYVRAQVNDTPQGWWHFDSGADSMIIDEAVAEALGMEVVGTHRSMGADGSVREGTWRRARSFNLGRIRIENLVFRAMDLSANNAPPGERRMGTIGYDLLARAVVEYGDGGRRVRVCDPATYRLPRGGRWQPLQHIDSTPAFPAVADGLPGLFQLDTGAAGTVDFTKHFHEAHGMLRTRETRQLQSQGSGGTFSVAVGRLGRLSFAGERFDDLEVSFRTGGISREGSAGTIGREVLGRFTIVFDYSNQRLAFLPPTGAGVCG